MTAASSTNRSMEYVLLALIFLGAVFEAVALGVDYAHLLGGPNFNLALDIEFAGLALIFFGFIGDVLYSHVGN